MCMEVERENERGERTKGRTTTGLGWAVRCRRRDPGLPDDWVALQEEQEITKDYCGPGS